MEIPIFLDSLSASSSGNSHNFTTKFSPALKLDSNLHYYMALDSLDVSYSWYNIRDDYGNNKFEISHDKKPWTILIIPNGNYDYADLTNRCNTRIRELGFASSVDEKIKDIEFVFDPTILKVIIKLTSNFRIKITTDGFSKLIGFNKGIIDGNKIGDFLSDITHSIDSLYLRCDLLSASNVSGRQTDVLSIISVANRHLSYPFRIEGRRLIYNKINTNLITQIRMYITDALDRPVNLNSIPISMTILLKEYEK